MRRLLLVMMILICLTTAVYAQAQPMRISAGGGAYFNVGLLPGYNYDDTAIGVGGFGFIDLTYAEISAGIGYFRLADAEEQGAALDFGLLLKYPFDFKNLSIFPLFGAKLMVPLTQSYHGDSIEGFSTKDYTRLGLQAGIGLDFPLSHALFFRTSALFDILFYAPGDDPYDDTLYSVGHSIKFGIGYRF